ncbi:MAG: hypothetical protein AB9869_11425 [Verrucomicrobiia bacterium]
MHRSLGHGAKAERGRIARGSGSGRGYRYRERSWTAAELYQMVQRRLRPASRKARFKTASLRVSINLQTQPNQPPYWVEVRLVFSAPVRAADADTWVIFLCTDTTRIEAEIPKAYSLRWSIEVYFKEIKQHLGFLQEQSGRYEVAYASVHLGAIRYLLLFEAMLRNGKLSHGEMHDRQTGRILVLTYALLLWELFRAPVNRVLLALFGPGLFPNLELALHGRSPGSTAAVMLFKQPGAPPRNECYSCCDSDTWPHFRYHPPVTADQIRACSLTTAHSLNSFRASKCSTM